MKRPGIITFFCVVGYIIIVFSFPQVFSPAIKKLGVFVPAVYGILVAGNFISYVGAWYFKQWGVQLFLVTFFAKLLFHIITAQFGMFFYLHTAISIVFIFFLLRFYPKMDPNL